MRLAGTITAEHGMAGVDAISPDHGIGGWRIDKEGVLNVQLDPDQRALADELLDRYSPRSRSSSAPTPTPTWPTAPPPAP